MKGTAEVYEQGTGILIDTYEYDIPETEPPKSTHLSQLASIDPTKVRPAKVKRMWEEREYFYDCFVTETIKDMYAAGNIQIGDFVLVRFDDMGEQLVTEKIYKSW